MRSGMEATMNVKKKMVAGLAMLALAASGATAFAGVRTKYPVTIGTSGPYPSASGGIGSARNSTDTVQQIGCRLTGYNFGAVELYCYAVDASGRHLSCGAANATQDMRDAVQSITDSSIIGFQVNSDNTCASIAVMADSSAEPKK
jgi:hypothetical protein